MRRVRYVVASSLDGYIAGPSGEADWIIMDPEIDFGGLMAQFDTLLIGRRTYETMVSRDHTGMPGYKTIVFSRSLRQQADPNVTVADNPLNMVSALRSQPGKDIWLFGGGSLFQSLLDVGQVDTVEVSVIPVLLGDGAPLLAPPFRQSRLKLLESRVYKSGVVSLRYAVAR